MAKPLGEMLVPILFFAEAALWVGVIATGGGPLLVLAALSCVLSGGLLLRMPSHWVSRPFAGASALFGLTLTIYQTYEASTLFSSNLGTLGAESAAVFGVFAVVYAYIELQTLTVVRTASSPKKA